MAAQIEDLTDSLSGKVSKAAKAELKQAAAHMREQLAQAQALHKELTRQAKQGLGGTEGPAMLAGDTCMELQHAKPMQALK